MGSQRGFVKGALRVTNLLVIGEEVLFHGVWILYSLIPKGKAWPSLLLR